MAFRFRLETVLRVKRRLEEAAQMELAQLKNRKGNLEQELKGLKSRLEQLRQELSEKLGRGMKADEFLLAQQAAGALEARMDSLRKELSKLDLEIRGARHRLTQAYRERKLVENLKQRHRSRYVLEQARAEQNELDELASITRARDMV